MSNILDYGINFSVRPSNIFVQLNQQINQITASTQKMSVSFADSWNKSLSFNQAFEGLENLRSVIDKVIEPSIKLNTSLTDLSAITGITGKALDNISEAARASAIAFGTDASQNIESYKLLASQLSPEIAKNAVALKEMGNNVNILSKTMGGDTIAATEVLTTAMNQYGVSLDDPMQASKTMADMMNVMAAAAQKGSAGLPQIKLALEQVGVAAKTAGITFSETNAAIQVLDKAGKKEADGGIALRNVLNTLNTGRFLPKETRAELEAAGISVARLTDKSIPLTDRLSALKPIMNDAALATKLFGTHVDSAIALVNGSEAIDDYNRKIQGTNTAVNQAKIVMGSYAEHMKRKMASWDDWKIRIFSNIEAVLPRIQSTMLFFSGLGQTASGLNSVVTVMSMLTKPLDMVLNTTKSFSIALLNGTLQTRLLTFWQGAASLSSRIFAKAIKGVRNAFLWATGATRAFSVAIANIPVIGWIAVAVTAIIAAVVYLWENCRRFREILFGIWEVGKLVFSKLGRIISSLWTSTIKPVFSAIGDLATTIFMGIYNTVKTVFGWIVGCYTWLWDTMVSMYSAIWEGIKSVGSGIGNFFGGLWSWFSNTFSGFAGFIDEWLVKPIAGAFSGLWTIISGVFDSIWGGLKSIFEPIVKLWNTVFPDNMMEKLGGYWQKIVDTNDKGQQKGGKDFDDDKKKKKTEKEGQDEVAAENAPTIPALAKLQTGKGGLKGFGSAAAASAKNTQPTNDKLSSLSNNTNNGGSAPRSLTINKLVETLIVKVERLPESKERIKDAVSEALLLAVNDYNLAT